MSLTEATLTPVLADWSNQLAQGFTGPELTHLVEQLTLLGDALVPHIVDDGALTPVQTQAYLLQRCINRLEDWLVRIATAQRRTFEIDTPRLRPDSAEPSIGLRSASLEEIDNLPQIGEELARKIIRYLAMHPSTVDLSDLEAIDGIGPARVAALAGTTHLESARFGVISPTLLAFTYQPDITNALQLLDNTDLSLIYGDNNLLARRDLTGTPQARFIRFVEMVVGQSQALASPAGGVLASEAERFLSRHELLQTQLNQGQPGAGTLLRNENYIAAAKAAIDGAQSAISLMVFLGTAADAPDDIAPLPLIEALEAAKVRGIDVRVILDQDDGGEPYNSLFINQPLVDRLTAAGIGVKFDEEDVLLHSKVLVVDSQSTFVGSHNWTRSGFANTHELSVKFDNAQIGQAYADRFADLWNGLP